MHFGLGEILVVLVVVLLVFGPTKLPQLGDALGRGIRNFKRATHADEGDDALDVSPSEKSEKEQVLLAPGTRVASQVAAARKAAKA